MLHKNLIGTLKCCERFLPSTSLGTLTLNDNQLADFTELGHLSHLTFLEQFTVANNPCCEQPADTARQFDYRPFVINWCLSIRVLDGVLVGAKERYAQNQHLCQLHHSGRIVWMVKNAGRI